MGSNPIRTSESATVLNAAPSAWTALRETWRSFGLVSVLGGLLGGLSDVASTLLWLAPGIDRWRLTFTLSALGAALGALFALVTCALFALTAPLALRPRLRFALVVSPALIPVAHLLFSGGRMRRLPTQWLLQPLTAVALVSLAVLARTLVLRSRDRLTHAAPSRKNAVGAGCFVIAFALHGADHRVLPRLYEYLHAGLGALTLLAFAAALSLVGVRASLRQSVGAAVLALGLGAVASQRLTPWANVRAEVFGAHSPFVRHGARVLGPGRSDGAVDPVALRRARFARENPAPVVEGALPRVQGAHVILVTVDALRADRIGRVVEGRSITPTLDALAATAVVFERAYAQAPHSSYSLSSLQTGEYLHETVPLGQPQPLATLADAMNRAGHHTAALYTRGIFFTEAERLTAYRDGDYGYVRSVHVDRNADAQTAAACAEIDDLVRRGEPPGLLWVHYFDAHAPYQGTGRTAEAQYDHAVASVDHALGELLRHARATLARPIIVAVTADHGEEFGEHGGVYHGSTLFEEQVRVPWILAAPGLSARRVRAPVELIDVAPTLLGLAGVPAPRTMRGRDLRPLMLGAPGDATVFAAVNTRRMAVRWPFKLIADMAYGVDELYDLSLDPEERRNLAERHPERVAALRAELVAWIESLRGASAGPIARARTGDRSVAPELIALALDRTVALSQRIEALDALAGFTSLPDTRALRPLLTHADLRVRQGAAVVLGRSADPTARTLLADMVCDDRADTRIAAGFALAALGDVRAVDPLVEALSREDENTVLDAIRALGTLGDARAIEALVTIFPDDHVRYRVALALGQLRDPRVFDLLVHTALHDATDDARANAVAALGRTGDARAVPVLAAMISEARSPAYAAEALGALGALGRTLDGWDARGAHPPDDWGFARCGPHEDTLGWRYLGATSCVSLGATAHLTFHASGEGDRLWVLRVRRANDGPAVPLVLRMDGQEVARTTLTTAWQEPRIVLRGVAAGAHRWTLDARAEGHDAPTVAVDHALLLRR